MNSEASSKLIASDISSPDLIRAGDSLSFASENAAIPDAGAVGPETLDLRVARLGPGEPEFDIGKLLRERAERFRCDFRIDAGVDDAFRLEAHQPGGGAAHEAFALADPHRIEARLLAAGGCFAHHPQELTVARVDLEEGDRIGDEFVLGQAGGRTGPA